MRNLEFITREVEKELGLEKGQSKSKIRTRDLTEARFLIFYIAFERYNISKNVISRFFKMDHTTVINGINKAVDLLSVDRFYRDSYKRVIAALEFEIQSLEDDYISDQIDMLKNLAGIDNAILKKSA